jgi:hypothetical protein
VDVDSLGVPMCPDPHVPRHRTGHIQRSCARHERYLHRTYTSPENPCLRLSVYRLFKTHTAVFQGISFENPCPAFQDIGE